MAVVCTALPAQAEIPYSADQCITHPYAEATTEPQARLLALMTSLDLTLKSAPSMREALNSQKPALCIDPRPVLPRGYLDTGDMFIALKSTLAFDEQRLILMHELRHLEQFNRGYCPSNILSMQENARLVMATEADAMAVTALLAWDQKAQGDSGPWTVLQGWQRYGDIALRFEAEITAGARLDSATAAAFDQWYHSHWRVESYYLASCSDYLDRLDESNLLMSYGLLPEDFLNRLCKLPDGTGYACSDASR